MSALTKEQIEEFTHLPYDPANANWYARQVKILCDMALRSLSAPSATVPTADSVLVPRGTAMWLLGLVERTWIGLQIAKEDPAYKIVDDKRNELRTLLTAAPAAQSEAREPVALPHVVEYCRKSGGHGWIPMAAYDCESVARKYADDCNKDNKEHWEYRYVYRPAAPQTPPMEEKDTGWISVKDRLPPGQGEKVQFWREPGGYAVGQYFGEGSWPDLAVGAWQDDLDVDNDACHNPFLPSEVTHWMPLPDAPPMNNGTPK